MKKKHKPSIDKVTTTNLDIALRAVGIHIDKDTIDKIIDVVELIEKKGDKTSMMDIVQLESTWTAPKVFANKTIVEFWYDIKPQNENPKTK